MKRTTLALTLTLSSFLTLPVLETHAALQTYKDVKTAMNLLVQSHPESTRAISLGMSDSGEEIVGLAIGNGPLKNLVIATHHGNEYGSTEVATAFAGSIAQNPIVGQTVFVIPVLNISGFNKRVREEVANGRPHDPNRDYPGPCGTEGPHKLKSTQALANFVAKEGIVSSATLHTYYPAVVYPWGLTTADVETPYLGLFRTLASAATIASHYEIGNSTDVIYPANGTFEDYAYWKHGVWSLLFELGRSHSPRPEDIQEMIQVNVPGLTQFLQKAPQVRAENHDFTGRCDMRLSVRDRHDE